jgi:type II secretory pathway pseudopilin PulG
MKIQIVQTQKSFVSKAFTLMEILVSMVIIFIMITSLYAGISGGFAIVEAARHNLRATELMIERFEAIRLISWDQLNTPGFISTAPFIEHYDFQNPNSLSYTGTITVASGPTNLSYGDEMKTITVDISWVSSGITNNRQMVSYIARYGLQNYVY